MKDEKEIITEVIDSEKWKKALLTWATTHSGRNIHWIDLRNTSLDEDVEEAINYLKREYLNYFSQAPNLFVTKEEKELQQHAVQSEIFGKLMTLVHEFKGWKGIGEVLVEFENYGIQRIDNAIDWYRLENAAIEKKIDELESLEEKNKNLKSKLKD